MRVAVHYPDGAVSAYKLGRIEDGVHNLNIITGEVTPLDQLVQQLVTLAEEAHPDCKIVVEKMVMHPDGDKDESVWIPLEEFDPEVHAPTPAGNTLQRPAMQTSVGVEAQQAGQVK